MEFLSLARRKAFWIKDLLKGGNIYKHYKDVEFHYYNYNSVKSKSLREIYINKLLHHAKNTVPFYAKVIENDIFSFPVVNKSVIKENYSEFISKSYDRTNLYKTTTSGSTGTPFIIYKDPYKLLRHKADNIFFSQRAGFPIGSKLLYLRVWNEINKKSKLDKFLLNIYPFEISNLSPSTIQNLLAFLKKDKRNKSILSFASALEAIAKNLNRDSFVQTQYHNIACIMAMSESLPDEARKVLEDFFSCPVLSRYSNMENGFIAQQESGSDGSYFINHGSFLVEILDIDKDVPVGDGKLGRIVITDYFNFGMPFIRYDTGDLGVVEYCHSGFDRGPVLSRIEGRKVDFIYNAKNELLSPHTITNTMWKYSDVKQFQFVQKSAATYLLKLNVENNSVSAQDIVNDLRKYLGSDAAIGIEYVQEIPLLSSGKRKKIVNEMI